MIIVSQDKTRIFNFNNITELFIGYADENKKRSIRCQKVNETYEELGIYETEERAKEVLKEITRYYRMFNGVKYMKDAVKIGIINEIDKGGQDVYVYTMPED